MLRDGSDRAVAGAGEDDEGVGNRKSGLFQAGAVERLASGARRVGGEQAIRGANESAWLSCTATRYFNPGGW